MDMEVRRFIQTAFRLPMDTPVGYIHAAEAYSNLGAVSLETCVLCPKVDLLTHLWESHDPTVRAVAEGVHLPGDPLTPPKRWRAEWSHWTTKIMMSADGRGLLEAQHSPISAAFLNGSTLMQLS